METLSTNLNSQSPEFKANASHHRALADELKQRIALVHEGGGEKYRARQESQGKLFVRERIERLLDPGSPFLELSSLAAWDLYEINREVIRKQPPAQASSPASGASPIAKCSSSPTTPPSKAAPTSR